MATPVKILTASNVQWSGGSPFTGTLLLLLTLPELGGGNYGRATLNEFPSGGEPVRLPHRTPIAVRQGVVSQEERIFKVSEISPPNSRYFDFWFDASGVLIATGAALLTINPAGDEYTIAVPSLPDPTAETTAPTVSYDSGSKITLTINSLALSAVRETLSGGPTDFTLSKAPNAFIILFAGGVALEEGTDYTRVGTTITFATAPTDSPLEAVIV